MQKVFIGYNSIEKLAPFFEEMSAKSVFLVTGGASYESSGADAAVTRLLKKHNLFRFHQFSKNPRIEDVEKGINALKKNPSGVVMAVGGGSVIDMAKLINVLEAQTKEPTFYLEAQGSIARKGRPLIVVPTTAGSGSEATDFAVVYAGMTKYSLCHQYLLPDIVAIDPTFSLSMPRYVAANSGMDALCQAVESYWSIHSTEESKGYAREAIRIVTANLVKTAKRPSRKAALQMAKGAYLAGKAIRISKTTAPHAVSYALTAFFGIPHGQAVCLTLPSFFIFNAEVQEEVADSRGIDYVRRTMRELCMLLGARDTYEASDVIRGMMQEAGLAIRFDQLGLNRVEAERAIVENVNFERLSNNPRLVTNSDLQKLLQAL